MTNIYSYSLIALSVISILGLLATGHSISSVEIKFIVETVIFFTTGVVLVSKKSKGDVIVIILLILTTLSLIDIYIDIMQEDKSVELTVIFLALLSMTLYQGFICIKRTVK